MVEPGAKQAAPATVKRPSRASVRAAAPTPVKHATCLWAAPQGAPHWDRFGDLSPNRNATTRLARGPSDWLYGDPLKNLSCFCSNTSLVNVASIGIG